LVFFYCDMSSSDGRFQKSPHLSPGQNYFLLSNDFLPKKRVCVKCVCDAFDHRSQCVHSLGCSNFKCLKVQSHQHIPLVIKSIHDWGTKKECLTEKGLQRITLDFCLFYIIIIVVDCCMPIDQMTYS
jgi:hypothetical protein